jgi:uncharacterized membrane protein YcaP (DUF421 family)
MDSVIRAAVIYLFLFIVFRIAGKRSLAEITTFDFILLLIIGEAASDGLINNDFSFTNAALLILTLVGIDILISLLTGRSQVFSKVVDSVPLILVDKGKLLKDRMEKVRVSEEDLLQYARESQGVERLDQIKYAVLEKSGGVSIIPKDVAEERPQKKEPEERTRKK